MVQNVGIWDMHELGNPSQLRVRILGRPLPIVIRQLVFWRKRKQSPFEGALLGLKFAEIGSRLIDASVLDAKEQEDRNKREGDDQVRNQGGEESGCRIRGLLSVLTRLLDHQISL